MLSAGRAWSTMLEHYHGNTGHLISPEQYLEWSRDKTNAAQMAALMEYRGHWLDHERTLFALTEHGFTVPITENYTYTGYIDLVLWTQGGDLEIWDHKFVGSQYAKNRYPRVQDNQQLYGYAAYVASLGYWPIRVGYSFTWLDKAKGPQFARESYEITHEALERWLSDLKGWIANISGDKSHPRNRYSCRSPYRCEFEPLCEHGINEVTMLNYMVKE